MKYEYRVIPLAEYDNSLTIDKFTVLQQWFDNGWEYVDTIQQKVTAAGQTSYSKFPAVGVIIRKEKEEMTL